MIGMSSADFEYEWEFEAYTEDEGKKIEGKAIYRGDDTDSLVFSHIECDDWDDEFEENEEEMEDEDNDH